MEGLFARCARLMREKRANTPTAIDFGFVDATRKPKHPAGFSIVTKQGREVLQKIEAPARQQ
jgi:hypothetical protein